MTLRTKRRDWREAVEGVGRLFIDQKCDTAGQGVLPGDRIAIYPARCFYIQQPLTEINDN